MTLLTVDELREHISTSLVDDAIQRLLDDAEAAITAYAGPAYEDLMDPLEELVSGGSARISVSRPIGSIDSVTERDGWSTPVFLETDDWEQTSRFTLGRLRYGTNRWSVFRDPVRIAYFPVDDTATRKMVQVELIKLEIAFNPALSSETVGAWTQTYTASNRSYPEWRNDILGRLVETAGFVVV